MCPHAGQVTAIPSSPRVRLSGQPATTSSDTYPIAGCAFNVAGAPHPCIKVQWLTPAARVRIGGQPAILQTNPALCVAGDQAPQGPPNVTAGQIRVKGM
jgi:hypothetical protein